MDPGAVALEKLACTPHHALLSKAPNGQRGLVALYRDCRVAGLLLPSGVQEYELDDIKRMKALFDVALANGMGCLVVDYVHEVCHDEYKYVSSEPLERELMGTEMVRDWAAAALNRAMSAVCSGSSPDAALISLAELGDSGALRAQCSWISGLVAVLRALRDPGQLQLEAAVRLQQALVVSRWCYEQGLAKQPPTGRHASRPAWAKRRSDIASAMEGRVGSGPFIADLCAEAVGRGEAGTQLYNMYPPASLEQAIGSLFLQGSTQDSAWRAKLAVMLYYLQDAGHVELHKSFRQALHLSEGEVDQCRAAHLLDSAAALTEPEKLEQACTLLLGAASLSMPFKFAYVLSRGFGQHSAALALLRSGVGAATSRVLSQAIAAMDIRLACQQLTEAYLEGRRHCDCLQGAAKAEHSTALMRHLLAWATDNKALDQVMELPLGRHEEKVLHNWLQGEGQERGAKAQLLPLYYIQRGRAPEALLYSERHGAGKQTNDDTARAFGCVLTAANEMMPLAQRQLCAGRAKQQQTEQVTLRCSEPRCEHMGTELDGVALLESTGRVLVEPVAEEQEGHGDVAGCRVPEDSMELDLSPMAAPMGPRMPPPSSRPPPAGVPSITPKQLAAGMSPRVNLFSAANLTQDTGGKPQPNTVDNMSQQEFQDMLSKRKGRLPAKRAKLSRR